MPSSNAFRSLVILASALFAHGCDATGEVELDTVGARPSCGDGRCHSKESCRSCPTDCCIAELPPDSPDAGVDIPDEVPVDVNATYVATTGSDASSCTAAQNIATPKRTLNSAVACLSPGETLYIRAGVYVESLIHNIPAGTSWSSPVTVAAYPGESVTLKPAVGADFVLRFVAPQQYIVIDGLILDGSNVGYDVIKITAQSSTGPAHHIRIQRSEVMNARANPTTPCTSTQIARDGTVIPGPCGQGILLTDDGGYNEFIDLDVHDNGRTDFDHGIYMKSNNNVIDGCSFHRNSGWGIHKYPSGNNNIIRNNRSYDNARIGKRGTGILVSGGSGNLVYNNLVWGNRDGITAQYGESSARLYNNTVFGNSGRGIYSDVPGTDIRNNIVYQNGSAITGTGFTQSFNLVNVDPRFVSSSTADFRLQSTSPAIDRGTPISAVSTDIEGTTRPQGPGYDIGAHEVPHGR